MNLKHATCGYPHYIHPDTHYYHYKHSYGYTFDIKEGYRNLMIPAYTIGGEKGLNSFIEGICAQKKVKKRPSYYDIMGEQVRETCKKDRNFIASKQIMTLDDFYKKWGLK